MKDQTDTYRELFERSVDAILIIENETFIDCNQATVDMLRCSDRAEVLSTHPSELSPPEQPDGRGSRDKANEMIALAFEKGSHRFEWIHLRADGEPFPVEVLLTAVREKGSNRLHVVWRDITERKTLEEQLRQAQKMEAIGKLTGGIAHDFNNLLLAIIGHGEILESLTRGQPEIQEHASAILEAGGRAADLVKQLLAFGRKQQLLPVALDLNALVVDLRKLLERVIGEDIALVTNVDKDTIVVRADHSQMEQVLLNLASNARDAMPRGGELEIRVERSSLDLPDHRGTYAHLSVTDSGRGMDADTLARAFEPFYTTKPVGKGTGLGLATVYGIVKQSGGIIELESSQDGTVAHVYLPIAPEARATKPPPASATFVRSGTEKVLVAEDEPAVARIVVRVLQSWGYEVVPAHDGQEGLKLIELHGNSLRLLITDVIMPGMGGIQLVEEIRKRGFSMPVLFLSGYTDDALSRYNATHGKVRLLRKPFSADSLLMTVRATLDEHNSV